MFNVNFNLKDAKSNSETLIYIRFKNGKKGYKHSTKLSVKPKEWDFKRQKARVLSSRSIKINSILDEYADKLEKTYTDSFNNGKTPTNEEYNESIKNLSINVEDIKVSKTFFEYFEEYIKSKNVKDRTKIKYRTTFNNLKEFQIWRNDPITFEFINDDFFHELIDFCIDERENLNSTTKKQISLIKAFLSWGLRKEYHNNIKFQFFKFPYNTETTIVYLTKEERLHLFNYDFSYNKRLERVRDAFMIACFTSGRIEILQKIFGHSKITTTMLYLGITAKDIEQDMNNVFPQEDGNLKHRNPEKIKTALSLLQNGIELSIISEATGLTFKELEKLKSKNELP